MIKFFPLFLFFTFFYAQSSFAQENYLEGKVIFQSGDTLEGYIDYRNWSKNPLQVLFKESLDHDPSSFLPGDIRAFHVEKERYVSAEVDIEVSPVAQARLTIDSAFQYEQTMGFLQVLIEGPKSLYYLKDIHNKEQFYILREGKFELLRFKKYLRHIMQAIPNQDYWVRETQVIETQDHVLQLLSYLGDCANIDYELRNLDFDKKNLKGLFRNYYSCMGHLPAYQKGDEKVYIKTGIIAGLSFTHFQLISSSGNSLKNINYPLSLNPSLGISVEFVLPRNRRRWSFNTELLFINYKVVGTFEDIKSEGDHSLITTTFGQACLKLNAMPRYTRPIGNVSLYLQAGVSNGLRLREINHKKTEHWFFSTFSTEEDKLIAATQKIETELLFGLGARYKRYFLEGRYEMGNVPSYNLALKGDLARVYVLMGYRF